MANIEAYLRSVAPRAMAENDRASLKQNAIARLQEINRTLLPDFPGKTPSAESVALARSQIMALIGDIKAAP